MPIQIAPSSNGPAVEFRSVSKLFGRRPVLEDLSFRVEPGERLLLLGPNGAGKTTCSRILASVTRPTSGNVLLHKSELHARAAHARTLVGYVPQQSALDVRLTARENLRIQAGMFNLSRPMRARRIAELLDQARLTDVADVPLGTFSGGMRRRIDIAAAMVHDPSILILDEPTTGLDIESRTDLWHNLSELLKDRDRSLIFTSHLLEDVERVATHVLLLVDGKSLIHATLPEFLRAAGPTHLCELRLHCAPAELASVQTLEKELARDERLAFNVTVLSDNRRQWTADAQPAHLVTLLSAAVPAGVLIESAAFQPRELASVYLRLTKRG